MDAKLEEVREQLAKCFGEPEEDITGKLSDLFQRAEKTGAVVYWGCWTEVELNTVL